MVGRRRALKITEDIERWGLKSMCSSAQCRTPLDTNGRVGRVEYIEYTTYTDRVASGFGILGVEG